MRVRVKFTKNGPVKFIGHLDVMRYFQKALRRAGADVSFSEGFSPHMIMSFAAPLGVGVTSDAEYFDLDLKSCESSAVMTEKLNRQMVPGFSVLSVRQIPETKAAKGMTLVAAASYTVSLRPGYAALPENAEERVSAFLQQSSIPVMKKTKRSEKEVDIRPLIYSLEVSDGSFQMLVSQGSVDNLKPQLVMRAFGQFAGVDIPDISMMIHRNEIYADVGTEERKLVPLEALGEEILGEKI